MFSPGFVRYVRALYTHWTDLTDSHTWRNPVWCQDSIQCMFSVLDPHQIALRRDADEYEIVSDTHFLPLWSLFRRGVNGPPARLTWGTQTHGSSGVCLSSSPSVWTRTLHLSSLPEAPRRTTAYPSSSATSSSTSETVTENIFHAAAETISASG